MYSAPQERETKRMVEVRYFDVKIKSGYKIKGDLNKEGKGRGGEEGAS